jgi:hypothetical protein
MKPYIQLFGIIEKFRWWQGILLLSSGDMFLSGSGVEFIQHDAYFTLVGWRQ